MFYFVFFGCVSEEMSGLACRKAAFSGFYLLNEKRGPRKVFPPA